MLDLIVLGIVPGTSFVITLWWALLFAFVCSLIALLYVELNKPQKNHQLQLGSNEVDLESVNVSGVLNPIFHFPGRNLLLGRRHQD